MPHTPRRVPPSVGIPPEFMTPPREHAPTPLSAETTRDETKSPALSLRHKRLSLRGYKPDNKKLFTTLFGKEPDVDPHTGQLVLDRAPAAATAAFRAPG